jgi:hypothetical protein
MDNVIHYKLDHNGNIQYDIKVIEYYGRILGSNDIGANIEVDKFMRPKIDSMINKYFVRIRNCKKQINNFSTSKKSKTMVQVRNKYECYELIKYAESLNLVASIYESPMLTDKKVKKMMLILPDYDSGCSKKDCSCARTKVVVENEKQPTLYILVQK